MIHFDISIENGVIVGFVCDACGVKGLAIQVEHHTSLWPPRGWSCPFGVDGEKLGPHACSEACQRVVDRKIEAETGRLNLHDSHAAWEVRPWRMRERDTGQRVTAKPEALAGVDDRMRASGLLPAEHIDPPVVRRKVKIEARPREEGPPRTGLSDGPPLPDRSRPYFELPPERRPRAAGKVVYFVQAGEGGPVKIGVSGDVEARVRSLQVAHAAELKVIGTRPGTARDEARLHAELAEHRIRGEWFNPTAAVLAAATGM